MLNDSRYINVNCDVVEGYKPVAYEDILQRVKQTDMEKAA